MVTIDHIVPQVLLRRYRGRLPQKFLNANQVGACLYCNGAKGDTDPVEWVEQRGDKALLIRLARRFVEMGVPEKDVAVLRSGRSLLNYVLTAQAA